MRAAGNKKRANTEAPRRSPSAGGLRAAADVDQSPEQKIQSVAEEPSFTDLIALREAQQARIRSSLSEQNQLLRRQLEQRGENGAAQIGDDGAVIVSTDGLASYFENLQQLITKNHEADLAAFNALRDQFASRHSELEQRINEIENKFVVDERTRNLLRDEQTEQHMTLCADLEQIRSLCESNASRLDARDEITQDIQRVSAEVSATAASLEERIVNVESLPAAIRDEVTDLDERFARFTTTVAEERQGIEEARQSAIEGQKEEFGSVLNDARQALRELQDNSADALDAYAQARRRINEAITEGIDALSTKLEADQQVRNTEINQKIDEAVDKQNETVSAMQQQVQDSTGAMKHEVQGVLKDLRGQYESAVEEQLDDIKGRFEEYEKTRQNDFPTADSDRVQLMIQELEGAFTMLEGIARNSLGGNNPSKSSLNPVYVQRLEQVESALEDIRKTIAEQPPRITYSIGVEANAEEYAASRPAEASLTKVERHLQRELELAAIEQGSQSARREAQVAVNSARGNSSPRTRSLMTASSPSRGPSVLAATGAPDSSRTGSVLSATSKHGLVYPPNLTTVRTERARKEQALEKVQKVLEDIHRKFQELTAREPQVNGNPSAEQQRLSALISTQKEAVYQKERQLVDHRNRLWAEIAELSELEKSLLTSGQ